MHFTSIFSSFTRSSSPATAAVRGDRNDPRDDADLLGRMCGVHGCERMLDEAPVMPGTHCEGELALAKRNLFPNSWRTVVSMAPNARVSWFGRHRRPKMIAVRYCEQCRAAAEKWMEDHLEA